jgi:inner membrane protein
LEAVLNKFPLLNKTLIVAFLVLLLAIPLTLVQSVVQERSSNRNFAAQEVARASAGAQTVVGPVLWVPYTETYPTKVFIAGTQGETRIEMIKRADAVLVFPTTLDVKSQLDTEVRMRGIFPVTVFNSGHEGQGRFVWKPPVPQMKDGSIQLGQPLALMGVSDARGLRSAPLFKLGSDDLSFGQTPAGTGAPLPLAVALPAALLQAGASIDFGLKLDVSGTGRLGFVPLADENTVSLTSAWPHPSSDGSFLPRNREVSDAGFTARWSVPSLSSRSQAQFLRFAIDGEGASAAAHASESAVLIAAEAVGSNMERNARSDRLNANAQANMYNALEQFSVALQDPVDIYRLTDRATKYGMMFVVLTFAAFFVLEMVKRWRIHPMQYLMVGAALVLFFLLLLSMSEHLAFATAYAVASAACIGLLSQYLRHVLGSWRGGLGMSGMLVALYGVLYGILVSEDNALMMGSVLLFGVLAAIMMATRKLDWYGVMRTDAKPDPEPTPQALHGEWTETTV